MSLNDLPPLPPLNPAADAYGAECLARMPQALRRTRHFLDVPYGGDYWQKLDIFGPIDGAPRGLPVLVFFHGGGWTHGYKEWCGFMAPAFTDLPALFVSVSYRLIPQVNFPAPFEDGLAALSYVHAHIGDYGGDPDRLFLGGHSAGGQIAARLTVRADERGAAGLPADVVKGCFCISTTFNRRVVNEHIAPAHVTGEAPDAVAPDSALAHARDCQVPFVIAWGGQENPRYDIFSRAMVTALQEGGGTVSWHRWDAYDHFQTHLNIAEPGNEWTRAVRAAMAA